MATQTNNLTADGAATFSVDNGREYGFTITGTWGGGTVTVTDSDGAPVSSYTENGGDVVWCVADGLTFTLSGSTSPDLDIKLTEQEI